MFKLEDYFLLSAVMADLGKLETEGELPQEEVQKFHATALSFYEITLSHLKKWIEKKLSGPGILQLGNLEQNTFMADIERISSHVIKTYHLFS
jgi:hypothetical protein